MIPKKKRDRFKKKHRLLIFHDSWLGIIWDTLISLCLLYTAFVLPVQIAFFPYLMGVFAFLEIFTTVVFILDILVNFNRSFLDQNKAYVVCRKKIARNYLRFWFWVDLLACFPIQFIVGSLHPFNQQAKLLKMSKVFNLIRVFRVIEEMKKNMLNAHTQKARRYFHYIRTAKELFYMQLFVNVIAIHNCACVVYYIPVTYSPQKNWVLTRRIHLRSEVEKYLFSLHWVIETFITVGFGENVIT